MFKDQIRTLFITIDYDEVHYGELFTVRSIFKYIFIAFTRLTISILNEVSHKNYIGLFMDGASLYIFVLQLFRN